MMSVSCNTVQTMFVCFWSPDPRAELKDKWESEATQDSLEWLQSNDLIDGRLSATAKGRAWIDEILATPLPVQKWVIERSAA